MFSVSDGKELVGTIIFPKYDGPFQVSAHFPRLFESSTREELQDLSGLACPASPYLPAGVPISEYHQQHTKHSESTCCIR